MTINTPDPPRCTCSGGPVDRIEHALSNLYDYLTIANSAAMTIDQLTRHCTFESDGTGFPVDDGEIRP